MTRSVMKAVQINPAERGMRFQAVMVTPAMSEKWLEKNLASQRRVDQRTVDKYARDMAAGRWRLTHQAIAFDAQGRLNDGQHRLWAVLQSGCSVLMTVCFDAPDGTFGYSDLGMPKSDVQIARLRGFDVARDDIGLARWCEANAAADMNATLSIDERLACLERRRGEIRWVKEVASTYVKRVTTVATLSAAAKAWASETNKRRVEEFVEVLLGGVAQTAEGVMVISLRDSMLTSATSSGSILSRWHLHLKVQRIIKAFVAGETLAKFYVPTTPPYPGLPRE